MSPGDTGPRQRAVVIGAGVAGLATVALLSREGYEVTVLERRREVGGRAGVLEDAGFRWDAGPSWYLMPEAFDHFYEVMGTSTERELDLVPLNDPAYRVVTGEGPAVDVRSGADDVARLFESIEPGAGKAVRAYLADAGETYRLAVAHFLYSTFTSVRAYLTPEVLRGTPKLVRLLVRSMNGVVSGTFRDRRLRQILTYPAVFLSNQPRRTPAMYGLMSHTDLVQGVQYPMGGFGTFVESLRRLAEGAGARIVTGAEVTEILTAPSVARRGARARAAGVAFRDAEGTVREASADVVVSCADLHHTETALLPRRLQTRPEWTWRHKNPGIGCVLAYLGVRGELPELAHHTLVFSEEWDPDFQAIFRKNSRGRSRTGGTVDADAAYSESVYVCRPSATDPSTAPDGHENLFVLIPVPAVAEGARSGDPALEDIVDRVVDLIGRRVGVPDLAGRVTVRHTAGPGDFEGEYNAWRGNALGLAHTLFQSAFFRGSNASRKVSGLYVAGSTTAPGVGLPMCLISAENVIKRLRGDTSTGPLATPGEARC